MSTQKESQGNSTGPTSRASAPICFDNFVLLASYPVVAYPGATHMRMNQPRGHSIGGGERLKHAIDAIKNIINRFFPQLKTSSVLTCVEPRTIANVPHLEIAASSANILLIGIQPGHVNVPQARTLARRIYREVSYLL